METLRFVNLKAINAASLFQWQLNDARWGVKGWSRVISEIITLRKWGASSGCEHEEYIDIYIQRFHPSKMMLPNTLSVIVCGLATQ